MIRGAHDYCCVLTDDLTVFSTDFDSHLTHLADILQRLRQANLTVNKYKCHFATNNLTLFGFHLCNGKITPSEEKTKVIRDWKKTEK